MSEVRSVLANLGNKRLVNAEIFRKQGKLCATPSDIGHFLPVLKKQAEQCESVFETGVRGVVSTQAFALGLIEGDAEKPRLVSNDIEVCDVAEITEVLRGSHLKFETFWCDNLKLQFEEGTRFDLTFIDTLHVYGQLKRELAKFAPMTNKYIILHDIMADGVDGEIRRLYTNPEEEARELSAVTGIPVEEYLRGLVPAVNEFIAENRDWKLHGVWEDYPGLCILERVGLDA